MFYSTDSKPLKCLSFLFAALFAVSNCSATNQKDIEMNNNIPVGQKAWPVIKMAMKAAVDSVIAPDVQMFLNFTNSVNLTTFCEESLFKTYLALRNSEGWAIRMLDSMGKPPSGVLNGNFLDTGSFEECLQVRVNDSKQQELFRGRYCLVAYRTPLVAPLTKRSEFDAYVEKYGEPPDWVLEPITKAGGVVKQVAFWLGTCLPSTCSVEDVSIITNAIAQSFGFKAEVGDCQVDEIRKWHAHEIAAVTILALIALLVVIGTFVDMTSRSFAYVDTDSVKDAEESWSLRCCEAFSIRHNTEKLLSTSTGSLPVIHGMRFFSAAWVILIHTRKDTLKYRNAIEYFQKFGGSYLPAAVFENFAIPVESFFFLSGLLLMYSNWSKVERSDGSFNAAKFLFRKFWRMAPVHMMTIVILLAMPLISSGPLWHTTIDPHVETCKSSWWKNLICIHNIWYGNGMCLPHSWYLSTVMQLHIVGVLLMVLGNKRPLVGASLGFALLVLCTTVTALKMVWHNFQMPTKSIIKDYDRFTEYAISIYVKPFAQFANYYIGMVFGLLILKYRHFKISNVYMVAGWVAAVLCAFSSLCGVYAPANHVAIPAAYVSLNGIGWTLFLGWMTFVCATGRGGYLNRFLSWKAFHPLSHLSYGANLIHLLVTIYKEASLRETEYLGYSELVLSFFGHVVAAYLLAYIIYIAVELPFSLIEEIACKKKLKIS